MTATTVSKITQQLKTCSSQDAMLMALEFHVITILGGYIAYTYVEGSDLIMVGSVGEGASHDSVHHTDVVCINLETGESRWDTLEKLELSQEDLDLVRMAQ